MTENQWYASNEHLRTEMSYEQYVRKMKKKKKSSGILGFAGVKMPKLGFN